MAKDCEFCGEHGKTRLIAGINMCDACFDLVNRTRNGDYDAFSLLSDRMGQFASEKAKQYMKPFADRIKDGKLEREAREASIAAARQIESDRASYAIDQTGLYEYDVVTVMNIDRGRVDVGAMKSLLAERAAAGWKLHTVYSNELGKNAVSLLGVGTNSTACEDVFIFERKLQ